MRSVPSNFTKSLPDADKAARKAAAAEILRRQLAKDDLTAYALSVDIPGAPVSDDPNEWLFAPIETSVAAHHRLILEGFARTVERDYGRLLILAPPGSAKSTYAAVVAPTWVMGRIPNTSIIGISYAAGPADKSGRRARQLVKSQQYSSIFDTQLSTDTTAVNNWSLTNGSSYMSFGILGGVTSHRADGVIIDDPVAGRQEAESQTTRDATWAAYKDDIRTRLKPRAWLVLIQTRWHQDDLAGSILPKDYDGRSGMVEGTDGLIWEVINLPAQAERADDPLGRKPGEYLWPEWFDEKHWQMHKADSRSWASLFQQRPRPAEGSIFKTAWLGRFNIDAIPIWATTCVHSWDTAQKEKETNDYSACGVWRYGRGGPGYHRTGGVRKKMEYAELRRAVINLAKRDNPNAILIEDKGSGTSLLQDLKANTSLPVIAIEPVGDKIFRAGEVSPIVESGRLLLPYEGTADWLADYESELLGFPNAISYKDQVDETTQFLKWVTKQGGEYSHLASGQKLKSHENVTVGSQGSRGFGTVTRPKVKGA